MRAYLKGVRYYVDAVLGAKRGEHFNEAVKIIAKYTQEQPRVIERSLLHIDRNGIPDVDDLMAQQKWYYKEKMIERIIPVSVFVDLSFVTAAAK
jgi:NitT/TauT family transport system substrate-binding protein